MPRVPRRPDADRHRGRGDAADAGLSAHMREALARAAADTGQEIVRGLRTTAATDAIIPLRAGYDVATLASIDETKLPMNYHWPNDVADALHWSTIESAITVCERFVRDRANGGRAAYPRDPADPADPADPDPARLVFGRRPPASATPRARAARAHRRPRRSPRVCTRRRARASRRGCSRSSAGPARQVGVGPDARCEVVDQLGDRLTPIGAYQLGQRQRVGSTSQRRQPRTRSRSAAAPVAGPQAERAPRPRWRRAAPR